MLIKHHILRMRGGSVTPLKSIIVICSLVFSSSLLARVPLAMTIYSASHSHKYWMGKDREAADCSTLLRSGRDYFQALTLNIDFQKWHQGYPNEPLKTNNDGFLHIDGYTDDFFNNLVGCMTYAKELGYSPILLKIKIIDYISPDGKTHKWRAFLKFNPLNGNYVTDPKGAVSLAVKTLTRVKALGLTTDDIIISVNDEYTNSIIEYPLEWKQAYSMLKEKLKANGIESKVAINLDWALPYFKLKRFFTFRKLKGKLQSFLSEMDLIGWSMYRPYWGFCLKGVRRSQLANSRKLRRFMNKLNLENIPMAVFEFGVANKWRPAAWGIDKRNLKDQRRAYLAWLSLLEDDKSPVTTMFSFWFGHFDPRFVVSDELAEYRLNNE
jgi:hypothetical protein